MRRRDLGGTGKRVGGGLLERGSAMGVSTAGAIGKGGDESLRIGLRR